MKKQILLFLSVIAIAFLSVVACKKDKGTSAPTKTQLITQGSWKFDKAMANGSDISGSINACFKDNIATFSSAGNMTLDEAANVCTPTSYAGSYTWSFQNGETTLHLSAPIFTGGSSDFTLVSLTSTNLVISQVMTVSPYPPTTVEVTFKH